MSKKKTRILICKDCGQEFIFTAEAQLYFEKMGWTRTLKRCKPCHAKRKKQKNASSV